MERTTIQPSGTSVERSLDDARTIDSALRLRQPAWAAAIAERVQQP